MIPMTPEQSRAVAARLQELRPEARFDFQIGFATGALDPMVVFDDIRDGMIDMPPPPPAAIQQADVGSWERELQPPAQAAPMQLDSWARQAVQQRDAEANRPQDSWDPRKTSGTWADLLPDREIDTQDIHFEGIPLVNIAELAYNAGWRDENLVEAVAVQIAENRNQDPYALGDEDRVDDDYGPSFGLWQIRLLLQPPEVGQPDADLLRNTASTNAGEMLYDPEYNAKVAFELWSHYGWRPWSVTHDDAIGTDNDYRLYMDIARSVVEDAMFTFRSGRSR